ncbi:MAG: SDR family oxidoreductase [Candidatus Tectomicrobia bacterium]|nr:SDR family oxidoreductase [Candidatus Tectomicrobia bacterium]
MNLKGKRALVTGSAVRVGRAVALRLAERGVDIAVHYNRSRERAEETAAEIRARGVQALTVQGDVSRAEQVEAIVSEVEAGLGPIDVLVNSASVYDRKRFEELTEEDWDRNFAVNAKAPFLLARRIGPGMKARGQGKIVNLVDWAAERPYKGYLPYCASKAALVNLTKSLALALAPEVQVNGVAPGPVLLPEDFTPEEAEAVKRAVPLKRVGSPEDVAAAVLFLIEGSDFITGAILAVDGGRLIA